jgi:hypothetical protein
MGGRIQFALWDEDTIVDELIGSFNLQAKDIIGPKNGSFFWKNIYGSPMGTSGDAAREMDLNPDIASFWKGRVLMQVEAVKTEKPVLLMQDIPAEKIALAKPHLVDKEYQIMFQVFSAIALP